MFEFLTKLSPDQIDSYRNIFIVVPIVVVLLVILYKKQEPIGVFFKRLIRITIDYSRGAAELDFSARPEPAEVYSLDENKEEEVGPEEIESDENKEEWFQTTPDTLEGWKRKMFFHALTNEAEEMKKAFDSASTFVTGDDKYLLDIRYNDYQIEFFKDNSYIEKINSFTDTSKYSEIVSATAFVALAETRLRIKDYLKSNEYYKSALDLTEDIERRCYLECKIAKNQYNLGEKEEALVTLEELLKKYDNPKQQVSIYKIFAEIYEELGDDKLRAIVTEKILELGEDDPDIYFNAAHAYSQSKFDKLSLLHYQAALRMGSGEGTLNNMGVQYDQLDMPIKSIEYYNKAFAKDNTLAAANMAYRLIRVGFLKEARQLLEDAHSKKSDDVEVHENVYSALASIKSEQEKEDEKEKQIFKEAVGQQIFFRNYAKYYFTKSDETYVDVNYFPDRDADVSFEIVAEKIKFYWEEREKTLGGDEYISKYKLEGELHNRAAQVSFYKESYSYWSKQKEYQKEGNAYLYINEMGEVELLVQDTYLKQNYKIIKIVKK